MSNAFVRGTVVRPSYTFYDQNDALYDPTWVKIAASDNAGTAILTATTMTKLTTGIYYYDWQTPTTAAQGGVDFTVTASCAGQTVIQTGRLMTFV